MSRWAATKPLVWRSIWCRSRACASPEPSTAHRHARYAHSARAVTGRGQVAHSHVRCRPPVVRRRPDRVARNRRAVAAGRDDYRPTPRRSRCDPRAPQLRRDGDGADADDRRRLRGLRRCRCPAHRSRVEDRGGPMPRDWRRPDEPADIVAVGEPRRLAGAGADWARPDRSLLPELRPAAGAHRARHRRHRRSCARPAGAGAVQRAL